MKTLFSHITIYQVTQTMFKLLAAALGVLAVTGIIGIIYTIITNPSVIDNASFGIYG